MSTDYLPVSDLDKNNIKIMCKKYKHKKGKKMMSYSYHQKICLISVIYPGYYHKYCGFNKFSTDIFSLDNLIGAQYFDYVEYLETKLVKYTALQANPINPNCDYVYEIVNFNYLIESARERIIFSCNPKLELFTSNKQINFGELYGDNYKQYTTLTNGSISFLVFVNHIDNIVHVYGRTSDVIDCTDVDTTKIFTELLVTYNPLEIFIGKSELNEMTSWSGAHGDRFDGNSILLRIGDLTEYRYICIGAQMIEFSIDERITLFVSSVGNSLVPYPYAESENYCYCMLEFSRIAVNHCMNRTRSGMVSYIEGADAYYTKFNTHTIMRTSLYFVKYQTRLKYIYKCEKRIKNKII